MRHSGTCTFAKTTHNEGFSNAELNLPAQSFIGHYLTGFGAMALNVVKDINFSQCFPT